MATRLTVKGQVTIPKSVRQHLGLRPGDEVEFGIGSDGKAEMRAADTKTAFREAIDEVRKRRPVRGLSTDAYMALIRDEP